MSDKIAIIKNAEMGERFLPVPEYYLFATSDQVLPGGCPIGAMIYVVDKAAVVVSDGRENWYRKADEPAAAGMLISDLF